MLTPGFTDGAPGAYFTPETVSGKEEMLNTENYLTQNLPPLFIMTANQDFLHDSAVRLDGYLLAKEIPHELHIYGDMENRAATSSTATKETTSPSSATWTS